MIARLLVWTLVAIVFHFVWRLLLGATARKRTRPANRSTKGPVAGRMVRDRMCQTFLPEADALRLEQSGHIHYFCSENCRELFLSGKTSP